MANPRTPAHRRGPAVGQTILDAAIAVLLEVPLRDVTIAAIAEQAGVHETSVYRRWRTREALLLDAISQRSAVEIPVPDTGSLRGDLIELGSATATYLGTTTGTTLVRLAVQTTAESASALSEFWRRRLQLMDVVITRAVERRELEASVDVKLLLAALIGPLHLGVLGVEVINPAQAPQLVDLLLYGVAARAPDGRRG